MNNTLTLAHLTKSEQELKNELNSLYTSRTLGPLIETRAERLSAELEIIRSQIRDLNNKQPVILKSFADLKNLKVGS